MTATPPALSRREALALGAAALTLATPARATTDGMNAAIAAFTAGRPTKKGRLKLEVPPLVENGNSVPMTVKFDGAVTPESFVKRIAVFNERNPQPNVAIFHLGPRAGRAQVATRIRLGDSQTIVAIAETNDGTLWRDDVDLVVTLPACIES